MSPSPRPCNRVLMGPILCRSCINNHIYYGFWAIPCSEDSVLHMLPDFMFFAACILRFSFSHWRSNTDIPFRPEHSPVTYSWHFDQQRVSAVTATYCKRKPLWSKLTATLIFEYKHKYFNRHTYPLSKTRVVASPLKTRNSRSWAFNQAYSNRHEFSSVKQASNLIRNSWLPFLTDMPL